MTFKEQMQQDIGDVFLNPAEFGEEHLINGKKMVVSIDDDGLLDREKRIEGSMDGTYMAQMLLYVSAEDFGPRPPIDRTIDVDGRPWVVTDVSDEGGMYSLYLGDGQG